MERNISPKRRLQPQLVCHQRPQRTRRPLPHDLAPIDDRQPIDEPFGLGQVVRHKKHGRTLLTEFAHGVPEQLAADRVNVVRWLIEQQQGRLLCDAARHEDALALPAAELTDLAVGELAQADALESLLRQYGIKELVRTGKIAILRGAKTVKSSK